MKLLEIKKALRNGMYAWPGGYPMFFITNEGEPLSFDGVRKRWRDVCQAHICHGWQRSGWLIVACDINWEDSQLFCAETNERIQSAYAEDEAEAGIYEPREG